MSKCNRYVARIGGASAYIVPITINGERYWTDEERTRVGSSPNEVVDKLVADHEALTRSVLWAA